MTMQKWMEMVRYRITEGSDYGWQCYGYNAYMLDSWDGDQNGSSFTIIFDTKTQEVFEMQAHDYKNQRAYRMVNPNYTPKRMMEAADRGSDSDNAWEDIDYVDLDVEDDFFEKATAIYNGLPYDTRVQMPVDFTDEELLKYMKAAHDRDMTFNQFVEEALREAIEAHKRDPEGYKIKAQEFKRGQ
jgi:hypothetical protein